MALGIIENSWVDEQIAPADVSMDDAANLKRTLVGWGVMKSICLAYGFKSA